MLSGIARLFGGGAAEANKQENDRIKQIYENKRLLESKRDEYMLGIKNRRARAKSFMNDGFRVPAKNELIGTRMYEEDLNMVSGLLLGIDRLVGARERAALLKLSASTIKSTTAWMKQTVQEMEKETVEDQSEEIDAMLGKIDRVQYSLAQRNDAAVKQTLSPADMAAIDEELNDMAEYDDADESASAT